MDIKEIERRIYNEFIGTNELHRLRIKNLFLDTILPEVLRDLLPEVKNEFSIENVICNYIEEKSKEKYNITL